MHILQLPPSEESAGSDYQQYSCDLKNFAAAFARAMRVQRRKCWSGCRACKHLRRAGLFYDRFIGELRRRSGRVQLNRFLLQCWSDGSRSASHGKAGEP